MSEISRIPDYLGHILQAIERIERHVDDVDEVKFLASELVQDAVIRNLEVIGEAANNVLREDASFASKHADIPWQVMYAMRNRLSHAYDKIDMEIVWKTIQRDLPELYRLVKTAVS
jgi:uncharacterized protein with HEPN domain